MASTTLSPLPLDYFYRAGQPIQRQSELDSRKSYSQFGTDVFLSGTTSPALPDSFSDVQTNAVYLNTGGIANTPSPLIQPTTVIQLSTATFAANYDSAATILLGIFPEGTGFITSIAVARLWHQGTPITRHYAVNDYEFYGQDSWRITPRLTLTYGFAGSLRHHLTKPTDCRCRLASRHRAAVAPIKMLLTGSPTAQN